MCSNDCDCNPVVKGIESTFGLTSKCRRCGLEPFIILDKVHVECRPCFIESCNKKLRSTIGKSKLVRNNDSILIAYSGGPSSCALLDLIWSSIKSQHRREQKFRPAILHVDMQSLLDYNHDHPSDSNHRCSKLKDLLEHLSTSYPGCPIYWSTIEKCFSKDLDSMMFAKYDPIEGFVDKHSLLTDPEAIASMINKLSKQSDLTDKQQILHDNTMDFVNILASSINNKIEKSDDRYQYLLVASSSTQLANNLLVDVILGRGSNACSTVNICDRRAQVSVMRPLRDFSKKEIAFYLRAKGIEDRIRPESLLTLRPHKSSIQTLTENFLSKLYVDYPATYSTLLRTGNKMQDEP